MDPFIQLLRDHRYQSPEWVLLEQVAYSSKGDGYADALAFNTWACRNSVIIGFEVKRNKADWRHELTTPSKAAKFQQYCHEWWIVAPSKLVPVAELPDGWGLYEISSDNKIRAAKQAHRGTPKPWPRRRWPFILRKAFEQGVTFANNARERHESEELEEGRKAISELHQLRHEREELAELGEMRAALGVWHMNPADIKEAVRFHMMHHSIPRGLGSVVNHAKTFLEDLGAMLSEIGKSKKEEETEKDHE